MENPQNPGNHPPNPNNEKKREFGIDLLTELLKKLDSSIEAQINIAQALDRLADVGEEAVGIGTRYDMVIQEFIERYGQKAKDEAGNVIVPILQEVSDIIKHFKELGEKIP